MSDVLSDEALEDLERKRQAATPGPWEAHATDRSGCLSVRQEGDWESKWLAHTISSGHKTPQQGQANARYIAAANPEAIGKLIAEVKATRARPAVLHVKSSLSREAQADLVAELNATAYPHPIVIGSGMDGRTGALVEAAEFFEAMGASGDKEPLTPSAIACLLREHAQERFRKASAEHSGRVQELMAKTEGKGRS